MRLGDAVATVTQPIARLSDDLLGTNLQNCEDCKKRQQKLNEFGDWITNKKGVNVKQTYNIQIQRADDGFIAIAQNDEPGVKNKKVVATSEDEIKVKVKNFVDHMFDEPPKAEKVKPEVQSGQRTKTQ